MRGYERVDFVHGQARFLGQRHIVRLRAGVAAAAARLLLFFGAVARPLLSGASATARFHVDAGAGFFLVVLIVALLRGRRAFVQRLHLQGIIGHIVERRHLQILVIGAGGAALAAGAPALREARIRRRRSAALGTFLYARGILFEQFEPFRQVIRQIREMQESILFLADINKGRLDARHRPTDAPEVDIA